jgi:hypothetical protein
VASPLTVAGHGPQYAEGTGWSEVLVDVDDRTDAYGPPPRVRVGVQGRTCATLNWLDRWWWGVGGRPYHLRWVRAKAPTLAQRQHLPAALARLPRTPVDGDVVEVCPDQAVVAADVAARIAQHGGAALFVDYGHDRPGSGSVRVRRSLSLSLTHSLRTDGLMRGAAGRRFDGTRSSPCWRTRARRTSAPTLTLPRCATRAVGGLSGLVSHVAAAHTMCGCSACLGAGDPARVSAADGHPGAHAGAGARGTHRRAGARPRRGL